MISEIKYIQRRKRQTEKLGEISRFRGNFKES